MSELSQYRETKDQYFAHSASSPLTLRQRQSFSRLDYYPENPDLRMVIKIEEFPDDIKQAIEMATTTGDFQCKVAWGKCSFEVNGESVSLTVYQRAEADGFFLPFFDSTTGQETYGGGRYLDVLPLEDGWFLVDFNFAFNPYCAYNSSWSCVLPPSENRLGVPIRAGEKNFAGKRLAREQMQQEKHAA